MKVTARLRGGFIQAGRSRHRNAGQSERLPGQTVPTYSQLEYCSDESMKRPVIYDITRMGARILNNVPNGIDRVDFALARHFLTRSDGDVAGLFCSIIGPRLAAPTLGIAAIAETEAWWKEQGADAHDPFYESIVARLRDPQSGTGRLQSHPKGHVAEVIRSIFRFIPRIGKSPSEYAPHGAVYIHANHFLLDRKWYLDWLTRRPDVRPVFFIHDLFPIVYPEFFWKSEPDRHRRRLANLAKYGAAAIVSSCVVATDLRNFMNSSGYPDPPICEAPLPISPVFLEPYHADPRLADIPYFVVCGTIEPRKNHLLLLHVWHELVRSEGRAAPKLVIVGKRGWGSEMVFDILDRSKLLRGSIIEVSGLSTPALKRLLDGAIALLMPSFAEGFGLPVAEALAAGVPVIASDILAFREIAGSAAELLDPLDGPAWLKRIRARAQHRRSAPQERRLPQRSSQFFEIIDEFVRHL
jgi:glycosyltransferase involved in cell wall biosynthesis